MARMRTNGRMRLLGGLASATLAGSAWGQTQTLFVMEKADLSAWVRSEKDQGLAQAMGMIPNRLRELPGEMPDFPPEARGLIDIALRAIAKPARVSIVHSPNDQSQLMGYGIVLSFDSGSRENANATHGQILGMLRQRNPGLPLEEHAEFRGMHSLATPAGVMSFGPRQTDRGWVYEIHAGVVEDPSAGLDALPRGLGGDAPFMRMHMDMAGLQPLAEFGRAMMGQAGEQGDMLFAMLEESGIVGEKTISMDYGLGFADGHMVEVSQINRARDVAEAWGLSEEPLSDDELRVIPADAVMGSVSKFDLSSIGEVLDMMGEFGMPVEEGLAEFREHTGVDLREDVLDTLGGTVAMYTSDSTGGGSLLSGVALLGVRDRDRLADAHVRLVAMAHQAMQEDEFASRYIRLEAWRHDGIDLMSLRFRGLPVPLELSYALTDRWLVLGATPQSVVAGVRQASGQGDRGIAHNEAFKASLPTHAKGLTAVTFMDSQRLARSGYPFASMLASAIANGVRSPFGDSRDPGMVLPTFHDLMADSKAMVGVSYWKGDDYVTEWRGDESLSVQMAVGSGVAVQFAPAIATFVFPAIAARERAMQFRPVGFLETLGDHPEWAARLIRSGLRLDPVQRMVLATLWTRNREIGGR